MTEEQREAIRTRARMNYAKTKGRISEQRKARRATIRETNRRYVAQNREKYYEYQAASRFKVKRADIQAIRASTSVCEICGDLPGKKRLAIDHDHATGVLRGMLCHTCNLGLGAFKDDVLRVHKAALYLAKHQSRGEVA